MTKRISACLLLILLLILLLFIVPVLLIFLIFVMLAAERKSEMGMERAVGARDRQGRGR